MALQTHKVHYRTLASIRGCNQRLYHSAVRSSAARVGSYCVPPCFLLPSPPSRSPTPISPLSLYSVCCWNRWGCIRDVCSFFNRQWKLRTTGYPFAWSTVLVIVTCCVLYLPGPLSRLPFARTLTRRGSKKRCLDAAKLLYEPVPASPSRFARPLGRHTLLYVSPSAGWRLHSNIRRRQAHGRLYWELLAVLFPGSGIIPVGYALVGGAAFVGSATHTVSVAVIAMEVTGQFVYMTPLILSAGLRLGTRH